jgi:prevent-host-death family protein
MNQVYTMSTMQINIKEARQRFSELINAVADKKERIIITSRNKAKAVLVSTQDAEAIQGDPIKKARRRMQLASIRKLQKQLMNGDVAIDSLGTLEELREERLDYLSDGN